MIAAAGTMTVAAPVAGSISASARLRFERLIASQSRNGFDDCTTTGPETRVLNAACAAWSSSGFRSATNSFAPSGVQASSEFAATLAPAWRGTSASVLRSASYTHSVVTGSPAGVSAAVSTASLAPFAFHAACRTFSKPLPMRSAAPVAVSITINSTIDGAKYVGSP